MKALKKIIILISLIFGVYTTEAIHIIDITRKVDTAFICINDTIGIRTECGFSNYTWKDNGILISGGVDPSGKGIPYQGDVTCMLVVPPPPFPTLIWSFNYEVCYDSMGMTVCRTMYVQYDIPDATNPVPDIGTDVFSCGGDTVVLVNSVACIGCVDTWFPGVQNGDTLKVGISGGYHLEAVKLNGFNWAGSCISKSKTVQVDINPVPIINTISDQLICDGTNIILNSTITNNVGVTYAWDGDVGDLDATNIAVPTATIVTAATRNYRLIATDTLATACADTANVQITMVSPLLITLGYNDSTICGSAPINLSAFVSGSLPAAGGYNFSWFTFPTNTLFSTSKNPSVQTFVKQKFVLTASDSLGCVFVSDTVTVSVSDLSISSIVDSVQICADDSVLLVIAGAGGTGTLSYSWTPTLDLSNPTNDSTFSFTQSPTDYIGQVTDTVGCHREDTIHINAISLPFIEILTPDDTLCIGLNCLVNARALGGSGKGYVFTWTLNSSFPSFLDSLVVDTTTILPDSLSQVIFTKLEEVAITVNVSVVDDAGCRSSNLAKVRLWGVESPESNAQYNPNLIFEDDEITFQSNANKFDSLSWILDGIKGHFGEQSFVTSYSDSGSYAVILKLVRTKRLNTSSVACVIYDTLNVPVLFRAPPFLHNVFTPNNDGLNETLWIDFLEFYEGNEVVIFNRWGVELYRATNYENDWTGDGLPDGTYYYYITAIDDSKSPHKGSFMIIR